MFKIGLVENFLTAYFCMMGQRGNGNSCELQIDFSCYDHPVVLTVEAQDKKHRFYIVSTLASTTVDLKVLSQRLGLGKGGLRMASEEALLEILQLRSTAFLVLKEILCGMVKMVNAGAIWWSIRRWLLAGKARTGGGEAGRRGEERATRRWRRGAPRGGWLGIGRAPNGGCAAWTGGGEAGPLVGAGEGMRGRLRMEEVGCPRWRVGAPGGCEGGARRCGWAPRGGRRGRRRGPGGVEKHSCTRRRGTRRWGGVPGGKGGGRGGGRPEVEGGGEPGGGWLGAGKAPKGMLCCSDSPRDCQEGPRQGDRWGLGGERRMGAPRGGGVGHPELDGLVPARLRTGRGEPWRARVRAMAARGGGARGAAREGWGSPEVEEGAPGGGWLGPAGHPKGAVQLGQDGARMGYRWRRGGEGRRGAPEVDEGAPEGGSLGACGAPKGGCAARRAPEATRRGKAGQSVVAGRREEGGFPVVEEGGTRRGEAGVVVVVVALEGVAANPEGGCPEEERRRWGGSGAVGVGAPEGGGGCTPKGRDGGGVEVGLGWGGGQPRRRGCPEEGWGTRWGGGGSPKGSGGRGLGWSRAKPGGSGAVCGAVEGAAKGGRFRGHSEVEGGRLLEGCLKDLGTGESGMGTRRGAPGGSGGCAPRGRG
ncbi:hypothetical protein NE237_017893 [Protea cynaroides]|uniref:YbaK/aminoacyl-tRNA synthetase-associated domain-containing protein n=1 Tax=Protea cynaroides TaxID=273540 RepID=A0A9Q0QNN1_9MAGN|nr:hypothetical protein NE237_017893 [Protea cynaroides]